MQWSVWGAQRERERRRRLKGCRRQTLGAASITQPSSISSAKLPRGTPGPSGRTLPSHSLPLRLHVAKGLTMNRWLWVCTVGNNYRSTYALDHVQVINTESGCVAALIPIKQIYSLPSKTLTNVKINLLFQREKWLNTTNGQIVAEKICIFKTAAIIFIVFSDKMPEYLL